MSAAAQPLLTVHVNGSEHKVVSRPNTPLLYVLREELGLRAARFGCGQGLCGACVVQLDGRAVFSCDTTVSQAEGASITTLEGLGSGTELPLHPLLEAFVAEQAAQCGYCVSGIVMRAHALLSREPQPSREQIVSALDRHLCRCGAQPRMLRAIERAAGVMRAGATPRTEDRR
jgi:nicotinate dehydrogenase subunit A